jgi:single-stranded DNA-binding protein
MIQPTNFNHLCSVTLLGNLVSKPDIRYRANPVVAVTEITVATHSKWLDKKSNQFKEWTSYHQVKVVGSLVEKTLLHATKGDLILVQGYLSNNSLNKDESQPQSITATFLQKFAKGYSESVNQIHCSALLNSPLQLKKTENNKDFIQADITINHQVFCNIKHQYKNKSSERSLHVWGKQALQLSESAHQGDIIFIEGKLSYAATKEKTQFIDGAKIHLFK